MAHPTVAVLERHLTLYKRLWRASLFSSFLLPLLFLVSIGLGVGGYVGTVEGVPYVEWIVPGVLASTAFQMAVGECTYSVLGEFKWTRGAHAMFATRVSAWDMVRGWMLYIVFRVEVAAVVFLAVVAAFGVLASPWAVVTLLVVGLLAVACAAPVSAFSASIDHDSYFALLFRFVMIPSTLFAGVFFPVEQLPELVRPLAYASPLWHGVELCRAATLGVAPPWPAWVHLGYLLAFAVAGLWWAAFSFRKRLQD
ncbi:ABC transporter permease [Nonomuraea africana]|uniref:Transport permease protein n=1 Tax=Nonomuraea africana TaxID=46171 RepID=A0ABR9KCJ0_9ACTN|nr:lipooligosaccharide transport system permease protein [Nonomuraea africana]